MIEMSVVCPHASSAETAWALSVISDMAGFFGPSKWGEKCTRLLVGRAARADETDPALYMPCWRCSEGSEPAAIKRVRNWIVQNRGEIENRSRGEPPAGLWSHTNSSCVEFDFDAITMLLATFGLLSLFSARTDAHGRTTEADDPFWLDDLPDFPFVSHIIDAILDAAHSLLVRSSLFALIRPRWPVGISWVLGLSHDVDHIRKWRPENRPLRVADVKRAVMRRHGILQAFRAMFSSVAGPLVRSRDPYDNILNLARWESFKGWRATYLIGAADPRFSGHEISYAIPEFLAGVPIQDLKDMGHEIGLHASYRSAEPDESLTREKHLLEQVSHSTIRGVRQHYLRFSWTGQMRKQVQSGFRYDSSWAYPGRPGFRGGVCLPFWAPVPGASPGVGLVELPMTAMDTSFREFLQFGREESVAVLERLIGTVAKMGGLMVLNWHNSAFDREGLKDDRDLFEWTVSRATALRASVLPLGKIAEWWEYRRSLTCTAREDIVRVSHPQGLQDLEFPVLGKAPEVSSGSLVSVGNHPVWSAVWRIRPGGTEIEICSE